MGKIYFWYWLGGVAWDHGIGSAPVCVWRRGLYISIFWPCRPDGANKMNGHGFHWWGGFWFQSSAWVDGIRWRGFPCGIDLGVLACAGP